MPSPRANATMLIHLFTKYKLSVQDLVALSGSHSIGKARCFSVVFRLYNQSGSGQPDPEMDPWFRLELDRLCPQGGTEMWQEIWTGPQNNSIISILKTWLLKEVFLIRIKRCLRMKKLVDSWRSLVKTKVLFLRHLWREWLNWVACNRVDPEKSGKTVGWLIIISHRVISW